MKFNVSGKTFQNQLQTVSKVIKAKNALSVLDNFLLQVEGDRLSITGSDQENTLTAYMEITDSDSDGQIAVPAKRLLEVIKELGNQPLEIDVNDSNKEINISFLNGHFTFMGVDAADYPLARKPEADAKTLILPASVVQSGIDNTLFAVSNDPVKAYMNGVCWDITQEKITFVGTDGHKLARYINTVYPPQIESLFILPSKSAALISGLIGKEEGDIKITFDTKGAIFEIGDNILNCLFIQAKYPNYNRVIPENTPFGMTIDRQTMLAALRRMAIFASMESSLVVLKIDSNGIKIDARDLMSSNSAEEFVACDYDGNPMTIGFNGEYMIDVLNTMKDDTVEIRLADPARPAVYTPLEQKENENFTVIQMPMQVL
ncbi:MAG: DNA polymerase III subunit beta [Bacteroidales bacterium]|nr:DNA polymerase III subunit beta [Bacteroidales bacterium]MDE7465593.1 DNA polymerase III subunit beta [Muribaculaceae bacterium]